MERVLVTGAANIGKAGVATIVFKWGQEFNPEKLVYDYLMQRGLPEQQYLDAINKKGGKVFTMKEENRSWFSIIKWVEKIIKENGYETIHINTDTAYIAAAYIYAAKKGGIKRVFVHSHCTRIDDNNLGRRILKTILHKVFIPYVCKNSQMYLACSKLAGYWMFRKKNVNSNKYRTIYNGVAVEPYLYDEQVRKKYRKQMGLSENFIIGNIGRFSYQKNHKFLIETFYSFLKTDSSAVLVLVGDGELKFQLKELVSEYGITDKVFFLGVRQDVPSLLSMFDVLVMPSRFEGLPVTLIEAQMSDLPCVVSDNITKEAKIINAVTYVKGFELGSWIAEIEKFRYFQRACNAEDKYNSFFNIKFSVVELEAILG